MLCEVLLFLSCDAFEATLQFPGPFSELVLMLAGKAGILFGVLLPFLFSVLCLFSSGDCISYFFHLCAQNTQQAAYKGKASLWFMVGKVFPMGV